MGRKERQMEKPQVQESKRLKSRFWPKLAGGIAIAALGFGALEYKIQQKENIQQQEQDQFEEARKHPEKRQAYLDRLFGNGKIPYCDGVIYDEDGLKIIEFLKEEIRAFGETPTDQHLIQFKNIFKGGNYEAKTPEVFQLGGKGRSTKIFLGKKHFEEQELTAQDFKHIIQVHEAKHAYQHGKGISQIIPVEEIVKGYKSGLIDQPVLYEIGELDANFYGLKAIQSGEYKLSKHQEQITQRNYETNKRRLQSISGRGSNIQNQLVKEVLETASKL